MTTLVLDTYRAMQTLQLHGYTKDQAEGLIEVISQTDLSQVATREDIHETRAAISNARSESATQIANVRADLSAEINKVRLELRTEISNVFLKIESSKNEMLYWMLPLIMGLYGLILFKL